MQTGKVKSTASPLPVKSKERYHGEKTISYRLNASERERLLGLESLLNSHVVGQPKAVSAVAGSYITKGGYDNMSVNYMYGDGVFVHASCSWILHENKYNTRSFRVNCEKGYIYIDRSPGRETFVKVLNDGSVTDLSEKLPFDSWHNEIVYFTDRLSKGLPVTECMPVDCEDSIKIIMAEMKSADKEGMKVDIV